MVTLTLWPQYSNDNANSQQASYPLEIVYFNHETCPCISPCMLSSDGSFFLVTPAFFAAFEIRDGSLSLNGSMMENRSARGLD